MTDSASRRPPNWPLLAGVRWMLAVGVVMYHLLLIDSDNPVVEFFKQFNAFALVLSFFFISGFSISHSIHSRPKGFLMRRVERIYPVYLVALLLAITPFALFGTDLEAPTTGVEAPSVSQVFSSLFMLQNTLVPPISTFQPSWSLAVECVFYVSAPLLVILGHRWTVATCAVSALFFVLQRYEFMPGWDKYFGNMTGMLPALYLAWAWLIGWLIERNPGNTFVQIAGFIAPGIFAINSQPQERFGVLVVALTIAALIYGSEIKLSSSAQKIATYLGDLSYPLYLVHFPVYFLIYNATKTTAIVPYPLAAIAVSIVVFHLIDQPRRSRLKRERLQS